MTVSPTPIRPDVVKRGDAQTLRYLANADLSSASQIKWLARTSPDATSGMLLPAVVEEVTADGNSVLRVDITPTETAIVGTWLVEIEATVAGKPLTFPSEGFLRLRVVDDLG